jgi:hypothetical protein
MKGLRTLKLFQIFSTEIKNSKTYSGCPFKGLCNGITLMLIQSGRTVPFSQQSSAHDPYVPNRGSLKRCRLSWLSNSALVYEPRCGRGVPGSKPMSTEPEFVNIVRSLGTDSQPGGPVRQPYFTYRPARLHRLAESIPRLLKRLQKRSLVHLEPK